MHAVHPDPRVLVAALAALILALTAAMAPRALQDVSFGSHAASATTAAPALNGPPTWLIHPLRSPLAELREP